MGEEKRLTKVVCKMEGQVFHEEMIEVLEGKVPNKVHVPIATDGGMKRLHFKLAKTNKAKTVVVYKLSRIEHFRDEPGDAPTRVEDFPEEAPAPRKVHEDGRL